MDMDMASMNKPTPPRQPEPHECCGTGCIPCVMDIYEEELWQYEKDLKDWEAGHGAHNTSVAE
jgi:hypothetical protein